MKNLLTTTLLAIFCFSINAQIPDWKWAKSAGGTDKDQGEAICTDASGNIYVTGFFTGTPITFGTTTLTCAGSEDIFIVKYDTLGNVLWAKSAGGTKEDQGLGISTDSIGNVYITGYFSGQSINFGTITLTNAGSMDIFVVKCDASGNVLWAKSAGEGWKDIGEGISTDSKGNVYVTGSFYGSITLGTTTLTSVGGADIFVVKYDASGNVLWAKSEGGTDDDYSNDISTDAFGNVYITGQYSGSTITIGTNTLTNAGSCDIFVVKYDSSGNVILAKSAGGTGPESGYSITTDANENIYITGSFLSPSIKFGTTTLTKSSYQDIFIVKYDASGNILWAKSAGGSSGNNWSHAIALETNGNLYITGCFDSKSITFGTITLTKSGFFIVKYDSSGNVLWAKSADGKGGGSGSGISIDQNGNVYLTGDFGSTSITFGTTTLISAGGWRDFFLAKMGFVKPPSIIITTHPVGKSVCNGDPVSFKVTATGKNLNYQWKKNGSIIPGATLDSFYNSSVSISDSGNYTCTISDTGYSITSNGATLTVNNPPDITTHPVSQVKKTTQSVTFTIVASGAPLTYQWQKNGGNISGATSSSFTKNNLALSDSGNYRCIVTNACGKDTSNIANLKVDKTNGINEGENDRQFNIYPNPSSGLITIETTTPNISTDMQIFDISGREVMQKRISEPTTTINISHLPQGLYYISLKDQKSVYFEKIVKQ